MLSLALRGLIRKSAFRLQKARASERRGEVRLFDRAQGRDMLSMRVSQLLGTCRNCSGNLHL